MAIVLVIAAPAWVGLGMTPSATCVGVGMASSTGMNVGGVVLTVVLATIPAPAPAVDPVPASNPRSAAAVDDHVASAATARSRASRP